MIYSQSIPSYRAYENIVLVHWCH